ncbi:3-hydroxyacyl-[acyl-carrier-protein] dehydratase, FabZ form [hydrothermal vent metagenome]|uniref:3-hydroxyacyl-[acyl-carrier-protein] dehydratase, FabZ form n=1 Tax=hydrothermal vent metagenome TaxID=652676 RepID=A0A3B1DVK5_9ZZZZ
MPPQPFYDVSQYDYDNPVFGIDEIRKINLQRFEMEQLTAIVHVDRDNHGIVGYKDISENEFWVRGHMPEYALMPGVVICECAAQLGGFYARKYKLLGGDFIGFGGMDEVRFRAPVLPGCRLVISAIIRKVRPNRRAEFDFQGFVDGTMVCSGSLIGVPIFRKKFEKEKE